MDFSEKEVIEFFGSLQNQEVQFILVGGLAVNFHGFSRSTADVDIWLRDDADNRRKLVQSLKDLKIEGAEVYETLPFIAGYTEIVLDCGFHIDLMSELQFFTQKDFEACFQQAIDVMLDQTVGLKVLHLNTLISEKEKSARPKDQLDAEELKKLYRS